MDLPLNQSLKFGSFTTGVFVSDYLSKLDKTSVIQYIALYKTTIQRYDITFLNVI